MLALRPMTNGQALVLGGGGVAGIAWMTGLLAGLADAGQDVTGADVVIGTSAGANVAAQIGSGLSLTDLLARQVEPARQSRELMAVIDWDKFAAELQPYMAEAGTPTEQLRNFGRFALDADTVPEPERVAVIESRLPSREWPVTPMKLTAIDWPIPASCLTSTPNASRISRFSAGPFACASPDSRASTLTSVPLQ